MKTIFKALLPWRNTTWSNGIRIRWVLTPDSLRYTPEEIRWKEILGTLNVNTYLTFILHKNELHERGKKFRLVYFAFCICMITLKKVKQHLLSQFLYQLYIVKYINEVEFSDIRNSVCVCLKPPLVYRSVVVRFGISD
jgi:hypothetical protein